MCFFGGGFNQKKSLDKIPTVTANKLKYSHCPSLLVPKPDLKGDSSKYKGRDKKRVHYVEASESEGVKSYTDDELGPSTVP